LLVLYTDGIIEIARDVIAGEQLLKRVLLSDAVLHAANPAEFIERAIANEAPRDDIAVLTVNFSCKEKRWHFEAADARAAYTLRDDFFSRLKATCQLSEEELSTCGVIFAELIGNAVRHAPGPLTVSLEYRGNNVLLHVIDKGPGFEFRPLLPENLWDECGRGLYLVATLAYDVEVERIPGLGSHISVTLPVSCGKRAPNDDVVHAA
jgi:anti-sigma regulatory factor (Ser/Thr protein kinase)